MHPRHHHRALGTAVLALALLGGGSTAVATQGVTPLTQDAPLATTAAATTSITRTDAPTRIRIGAPKVSFNVAVTTSTPVDGVQVKLVGGGGRVAGQGSSADTLPGRPTMQRATVTFDASSLPSWGLLEWRTSAWRTSDGSCTLVDAASRVDVRAHTLAALSGTRSGDVTSLTGTLRAYHSVQGRMVPWTGRPVAVQRLDGDVWKWVATSTSDRHGEIRVKVKLPRGTQLRVVTGDVTTAWGATSKTYRL